MEKVWLRLAESFSQIGQQEADILPKNSYLTD